MFRGCSNFDVSYSTLAPCKTRNTLPSTTTIDCLRGFDTPIAYFDFVRTLSNRNCGSARYSIVLAEKRSLHRASLHRTLNPKHLNLYIEHFKACEGSAARAAKGRTGHTGCQALLCCNVIIRIGFWGTQLYNNYKKEPPKTLF